MKKNYLILGTIISGFIVLGLIFEVVGNLGLFGSSITDTKKETLSVNCKNGYKIISTVYSFIDKSSRIDIFEKPNGFKTLVSDGGTDFGGNGSSLDIFNNSLNGSIIADFPHLDYMQKNYTYEIINPREYESQKQQALKNTENVPISEDSENYRIYTTYKLGSREFNIPATYLDKEKNTKEEFDILVDCIKNKYPKMNKSYIGSLNSVLVYGKPYKLEVQDVKGLYENKDSFYNGPITPFGNSVFEEFICQEKPFRIFIHSGGSVIFGYLEYFEKSKNTVLTEIADIGYFDKQKSFNRFKNMQYNHNFFDGYKLFDKNGKFTKIDFKNIAFDKAYQESQTLKLLFNQKQEPINDYLQTCKNVDGKTLFDIFKTKTNLFI